jgi:hypothetical protein
VLNRPTSVTNREGSTQLSNYVYTYYADGLKSGVTERQLEADGTYSTVTINWTYDNLQRLTQEQYVSSIAGNSYTAQYTFDLVGNRLTKTTSSSTGTEVINSTYNANDQLLTDTATLDGGSGYQAQYGYDADGSLVSVNRTGTSPETDTYGYDLQQRLASATVIRTENAQAVQVVASFAYNDGIRAQSTTTTTIGSGTPTTVVTQYLTDPFNPTGYSQTIEEHTNGSTTVSKSYLIGLTVFGQATSLGAIEVLLSDASASTRLLTDTTGAVIARYAYDAYGNLLYQSVGVLSVPATSILYVGQQYDSILLQYSFRARYYNWPFADFEAAQAARFAQFFKVSTISRSCASSPELGLIVAFNMALRNTCII